MTRTRQAGHLLRRFGRSLSPRPPDEVDVSWAVTFLTEGEQALWEQMATADRRHSIEVAKRFAAGRASIVREEMAAALLHDVGKIASGLGTLRRVLATVIGPRTRRFRQYHDHERIGADLLRRAGSAPATVALVAGTSDDPGTLAALRAADDV